MLSTETSQYFCSIRLFSSHSSAEHLLGSARYRGMNNKNWNTVKRISDFPRNIAGILVRQLAILKCPTNGLFVLL